MFWNLNNVYKSLTKLLMIIDSGIVVIGILNQTEADQKAYRKGTIQKKIHLLV